MSETIDILCEMRNYSNESNNGYVTDYGVVLKDMARFADRIEAACKRECGNAAKMREALIVIHALLGAYVRHEILAESLCLRIENTINAAFVIPPRNCDVGTAEEQSSRYNKFCFAHRTCERGCGDCPLAKDSYCEFAWAQMPYEEGGEK